MNDTYQCRRAPRLRYTLLDHKEDLAKQHGPYTHHVLYEHDHHLSCSSLYHSMRPMRVIVILPSLRSRLPPHITISFLKTRGGGGMTRAETFRKLLLVKRMGHWDVAKHARHCVCVCFFLKLGKHTEDESGLMYIRDDTIPSTNHSFIREMKSDDTLEKCLHNLISSFFFFFFFFF